jgi:glucokinase
MAGITEAADGILVDIGGTKIMVGVARGGALLETASFRTADCGDAGALTTAISAAGAVLAERHDVKVQAAAVAVPGMIDRAAGVVRRAANLPFDDFPLAAELSRHLGGVPVRIEHDANCGVLGEAALGAGRGSDSVVFLTVSTGIGMGALIDGTLLEGASGAAGEIGHTPAVPGGRPCVCGAAGCLEAYSSGGAMENLGREVLRRAGSPMLGALAAAAGEMTAREVIAAADLGDEACGAIVTGAVQYLSSAIQVIVGILDPGIIVLGGGVMGNPAFTGRVLGALRPTQSGPRVRRAELGDRSVISGGLAFLAPAVVR